jgi:hypothetical protein
MRDGRPITQSVRDRRELESVLAKKVACRARGCSLVAWGVGPRLFTRSFGPTTSRHTHRAVKISPDPRSAEVSEIAGLYLNPSEKAVDSWPC